MMDPINSSLLNAGFKSDDSRRYNTNKFDFYSGSQITIWFGNICLDDVRSIGWERRQNKMPIYGYASQQFDGVAKGVVTIEGEFIVNFRQAGYISMLMDVIKSLYTTGPTENWDAIRSVIGQHLKNGTFGPSTAQEIRDLGNDPNFTSLAASYENIIWDGGVPGDVMNEDYSQNSIWRASDVIQQDKIPDGFNILITYGNTTGSSSRSINDYIKSTVKSLVNVHLTGESQIINVNGEPTYEVYTFMARGTDEQLGNER